MSGQFRRLFSLGLILLANVGCGSTATEEVMENPNLLNPVKGVITLNGKDIPTGSIVTFHPKEAGASDQKITGTYSAEESYFSVMTVKGGEKFGGAPEGTYTVTIQAPRKKPGSIPAKYGNPATSGLEVEVKKGVTEIPEIKLAS